MSTTPTSRRVLIVKELLETEKNYVKNLNLLCRIFIPKCRPNLTKEQDSSLFNNIESIFSAQEEFYKELDNIIRNFDDNTSQISPTFLKYTPFFKPYKQYSANYDYAQETLNKILKKGSDGEKIKQILSDPQFCGVSDLTFYLIQPIQRIPRYILLLKDLIKNTNIKHVDFKGLGQVLEILEGLAIDVNDTIKEAQQLEVLRQTVASLGLDVNLLYQPYRTYLFSDMLYKHVPRGVGNKSLVDIMEEVHGVDSGAKLEKKDKKDKKEKNVNLNTPSTPSVTIKDDKSGKNDKNDKKAPPTPASPSLVGEGTASKHTSDPVICYSFYLFNDLIAVVTQNKGKLQTNQIIPIDEYLEVIDGGKNSPSFILMRRNDYGKFQTKISTPDFDLKQKWVQNLTNLILESKKRSVKTNNFQIFFKHSIDFPAVESHHCSNCYTQFTITTHRHTCKFCCEVICDECGKDYQKPEYGQNREKNGEKEKEYRICKLCKITNNSHKTPTSNSTTLTEYSKQFGLPAKTFVLPHRFFVQKYEGIKVGQNGKHFPITFQIFNDMILICNEKNGNFTLQEVLPLDKYVVLNPSVAQEEQKKKQKNSNFLKTISLECEQYKDQKDSAYHTKSSFVIKRDRSVIKYYLNDSKEKHGFIGLSNALISLGKSRLLTNSYEFIYYNNVPSDQCDGKCTLCDASFWFFKGFVTCPFCNLFVCKACSRSTAPISPHDIDNKYQYRCCDECKNQRPGAQRGSSWFL